MSNEQAGWDASAAAYIAFQGEAGDPSRSLLLDPIMLEQCGDVRGARMLDVGCGEGRFCRMLGERGAHPTGIDPTLAMIEAAQARGPSGGYVRSAAESLPFRDGAFELVVSYITLVDIRGYREAIAEMARVLAPGGRLVVANLGFVTASAGWQRDADGRRLHHRIDRYLDEFAQTYDWSGIRIVNWHRPLSAYMAAYLAAGLELRAFLEPHPADDALRDDPRYEDWYRVPDFTVTRWAKPAARG